MKVLSYRLMFSDQGYSPRYNAIEPIEVSGFSGAVGGDF
jgi:hypothetical protein